MERLSTRSQEIIERNGIAGLLVASRRYPFLPSRLIDLSPMM
jgi:hypothetical protein